MSLLRGDVMNTFERTYTQSRGFELMPDWGDSQQLTRHIAAAQVTRLELETMLGSRAIDVSWMQDVLLESIDFEEEYPEGEEPDEPDEIFLPEKTTLGAAFSL